jgi:hypothetical protein
VPAGASKPPKPGAPHAVIELAEVQVMGTDPLRFPEVDYSSAQNDFGGLYNAPSYPNIE